MSIFNRAKEAGQAIKDHPEAAASAARTAGAAFGGFVAAEGAPFPVRAAGAVTAVVLTGAEARAHGNTANQRDEAKQNAQEATERAQKAEAALQTSTTEVSVGGHSLRWRRQRATGGK